MSASVPAPVRGLLLAVVALAPLPLASNRPVFEALLALAAACGLALWALAALRRPDATPLPWKSLKVPLTLAGLALLWIAVQTLPMPDALTHPGWRQAAALLHTTTLHTISIDPAATRIALLRLLTFVTFFALAYQSGRDLRFARQLLNILMLSAALYASYGLFVFLEGNTHILWLEKWAYPDSLTATHVNRNSFAAYAGMGLLAALTVIFRHLKNQTHGGRLSLADALIHLRGTEWLALAAVLLILPALFLSNSRAGLAAVLLGGLVFMLGLLISGAIPRRITLALMLFGLVTVGGNFLLFGEGLETRLATIARDDRPEIWRITTHMIADFPLAGQGLGTYAELYPVYRDEKVWPNVSRAHNTYLEWAAEAGLPATLLWFLALGAIGLRLLQGVRTRRQGVLYPIAGLALLAEATLHSAFDFSFQVTANAVIFAILLGMTAAQSFPGTAYADSTRASS